MLVYSESDVELFKVGILVLESCRMSNASIQSYKSWC